MTNQRSKLNAGKWRTYRLMVFSLIVGASFPLAATIKVMMDLSLEFSYNNILKLHSENPVLQVLDVASLVLLVFFITIRVKQIQLERTNQLLISKTKKLSRSLTITKSKNKELDQFGYIVTHDLKAPLRAARNLLAWISDDVNKNCSEDTKSYVLTLNQRLNYMDKLIVDILQYSKTGKLDLIDENINTNEVMNEIISNLDIRHKFKISVSENMPMLNAPRVYFQQVFMNLISNAAKYHDKIDGIIEVNCSVHPEHVVFEISDDGPGIDPIYHTKVFGLFQTLDHKGKGNETGVGLAIVKKIVKEINGNIKLESELKQGSRFIVEWPIKKAA
jgi:signal transduction histidine kinase